MKPHSFLLALASLFATATVVFPASAGQPDLKGQVLHEDGSPVSKDTEVVLDSEGRFQLTGLAEEPVSLNVRVKGYKCSQRNPSLDWLNSGIVGTVDRDIADLVILLEPGEWRPNREDEDRPAGVDAQPYQKPLRGAKL